MARKSIILVLILAAVVGLPYLRSVVSGGQELEVAVETLEPRSIQASVLASGQLAHEEEVQLTTEEIGKVTEIYVEEGDEVSRGQLLLQIDDELHRASVEQNEANVRVQEIAIQRQQLRVENLRRQWERQQELYERDLIDQDSFDEVTNQLSIAEVDLRSSYETLSQASAQLEQAQDRLAKTRAYSPIDGTVTSLDIEVGETAISSTTNIPGSSLMTIADPDSIHTEVNVDEADIANIAVGQRAQVFAIAYPNTPIEGMIKSIALSAKVAEGAQGLSFTVEIALKPTHGVMLRPGMTCRAEIFTEVVDDALAAPIQAILVDEDLSRNQAEYYVFVNRDGRGRARRCRSRPIGRRLSDRDGGAQRGRPDHHRPRSRAARARGRRENCSDGGLSASMPIIELSNISKHYQMGDTLIKAVDEIDLTIERNEYIVIIGSSGSGKSTVMNIIGCLDTPTSGDYVLNEREVAGLNENELADIRNEEIGFIFQNFNLLPRVNALQNVMQPLIYRGLSLAERREEAAHVLERVGLTDRRDHLPNELSGGQRQRVAIARALVTQPALLLADEPTGNLDSRTTIEILELFDELHTDGQTILVVTHEPEIAAHSQRIIRLQDGRIVEDIASESRSTH